MLLFFSGLCSCTAQPDSVFYDGLTIRADGTGSRKKAAAHFEAALKNRSPHVRAAAAAELLSLYSEGEPLSAAAMAHARREASGSWAAALAALGAENTPSRETALACILGGITGGGPPPDEAVRYVLRECRKRTIPPDAADSSPRPFFSEAENAAIDGHFASSESRFREALVFFRLVRAAEPDIFFHYPALINDLGRCFQYAVLDDEGINLFLEWEKNLAGNPAGAGKENNIRFRLLFFAARIARQRGQLEQGIELFARALSFAPDSSQADACIWYILDSAVSRSPAAAIRQLETYVPLWNDAAYFSGVLDKLARELVLRRQWKDILTVFGLIRDKGGAAGAAKYAWITGRSIEEGYFSPEEIRMAATLAAPETNGTASGTDTDLQPPEPPARSWIRIAYNTGDPARPAGNGALLYYRSQSAAVLGEPFITLPENTPAAGGANGKRTARNKAKTGAAAQSTAMEFLSGFFHHRAASFAPRYIRLFEQELSAAELRSLAGSLNNAGLYAESMRLVSVYMGREGYEPERQDLELQYPRPFKNLVEKYAKETGIAPALLYALIRTESAFQSGIVSRAGAVGLTQLMPATAAEMAGRIRRGGGPDYSDAKDGGNTDGADNDGEAAAPDIQPGTAEAEPPDRSLPDLRTAAVNIHIGAFYLAYLMERLEDPLLALLAYNGGMNRVRRWRQAAGARTGQPLPADLFLETVEYPETREYGRKVLAAAAVYELLYYGKDAK
ncbi:MAG: lytic transglycosylase domain-containing protein [Treponema sp.]|nr:lytic transglycosylase domain-containing protein [Treponema sp.]